MNAKKKSGHFSFTFRTVLFLDVPLSEPLPVHLAAPLPVPLAVPDTKGVLKGM